jgi:hypothetical protein
MSLKPTVPETLTRSSATAADAMLQWLEAYPHPPAAARDLTVEHFRNTPPS